MAAANAHGVPPSLRIALASASDARGGAARAALRLHIALREADKRCVLVVDRKYSECAGVHGAPDSAILGARVRGRLEAELMKSLRRENPGTYSASLLAGSIARRLRRLQSDVVNLHWVNGGCLSVAQIGRIEAPLVWTLHDMWAFSGTPHYSDDGPDARWRSTYGPATRPAGARGPDVDAWTWRRKRARWTTPQEVVTPSRWLADCVRSSSLMGGWPVTVIPNALPVDRYRPHEQRLARDSLGLPQDVPLILFGAMGGDADPRKGFDLLTLALDHLGRRVSGVHAVVFGGRSATSPPSSAITWHDVGVVEDDTRLAQLYSAADVMVVPSRRDNLPQTGTEAQSCATPVVAFDTGGLGDVIEDRVTGYLAKPFDAEDLANGIAWVLEDGHRRRKLSDAARARAVRLWSPDVIVPQYLNVYRSAVEKASCLPTVAPTRLLDPPATP